MLVKFGGSKVARNGSSYETKGTKSPVAGKIKGTVVSVTDEGDLITDLEFQQLAEVQRTPETKIIVDEEHETFGIFDSNHNQPAMTLIAILDEQHPLRLHLVSDSASMMLGVRKGASVEIVW